MAGSNCTIPICIHSYTKPERHVFRLNLILCDPLHCTTNLCPNPCSSTQGHSPLIMEATQAPYLWPGHLSRETLSSSWPQ